MDVDRSPHLHPSLFFGRCVKKLQQALGAPLIRRAKRAVKALIDGIYMLFAGPQRVRIWDCWFPFPGEAPTSSRKVEAGQRETTVL